MLNYTIYQLPPSNNKFIGRTNRWEYQSIKKEWADLIRILCRPKPHTPIDKAIVTLHYHFTSRARRDPDNYSGKMILDGLVRAGIIADDSFSHINLVLKAGYDKDNPRTEITIEEVDNIV